MSANRLRYALIGILAVAAVVSVVARKVGSPLVGWASFALLLCAIVLYLRWRRAVLEQRRASVFARESKTDDETRARPDQ